MDVVDLAQARERAADREVERELSVGMRELLHVGAKSQEPLAFGRGRAREQGRDCIDDVKFQLFAQLPCRRLAVRDVTAELLERAHLISVVVPSAEISFRTPNDLIE